MGLEELLVRDLAQGWGRFTHAARYNHLPLKCLTIFHHSACLLSQLTTLTTTDLLRKYNNW